MRLRLAALFLFGIAIGAFIAPDLPDTTLTGRMEREVLFWLAFYPLVSQIRSFKLWAYWGALATMLPLMWAVQYLGPATPFVKWTVLAWGGVAVVVAVLRLARRA